MTSRTKLWALSAGALALSLALAGCGGGGSSSSSVTTPGGGGGNGNTPPPVAMEDPAPADGDVTGVPQTTGLLAAVAAGHDTITIAAGASMTVGGVTFTCAGETDCTVTLSVTDGVVSAQWEGAGEEAGVTAEWVDPLLRMNPRNGGKVTAIMSQPLGQAADSTQDPPQIAGVDNASTTNLKDGPLGITATVTGAGAADDSGLVLTDTFDPFVVDATDKLEAGTDDDIGAGALGLAGWDAKLLFADWGDTKEKTRDGGFETAALIYSNIGEATEVAFKDVPNAIAHEEDPNDDDDINRAWFSLTGEFDAAGDSVSIADATAAGAAIQVANSLISPTGQTFSGLVAHPSQNDEIRGTYFGASGTFKCANTTCQISRDETGANSFAVSAGAWLFKPDDDATVTLSDQDWVAFGVWMTAPDDIADGEHRLGVFYDGMDAFGYTSAKTDGGLSGQATYTGSAAGYYVNRSDHGVFTASASLDANFDTDMLSGTINDFRKSDGTFVDSDTLAEPNDPATGGEGDWTVGLMATMINDAGTFAAPGMIRFSADGVSEGATGMWNAQFYGPGDRHNVVEDDRPEGYLGIAPTGVGGNFRAMSRNLGTEEAPVHKGVVGAFGATLGDESHEAVPTN